MQEGGDGALLVERILGCEGERIDADELTVGRLGDEPLDGVDGFRSADCRSRPNMAWASLMACILRRSWRQPTPQHRNTKARGWLAQKVG